MSELEEAKKLAKEIMEEEKNRNEKIYYKYNSITWILEVLLSALDNSIPREVVEMTLERLEREKVKAIENDDFISVSDEGKISLCKELLEKSQIKVK